MTIGEANWILWGLALQVGLCPADRKPLRLTVPWDSYGNEVHHCWHCYRDWFLNPDTGKYAGWWLTPSGWYYSPRDTLSLRNLVPDAQQETAEHLGSSAPREG